MPEADYTGGNGPVTATGPLASRRHDPRFDERPVVRAQERSIGELMGALSQDLTLLLRQEVALAKAEVGQKATVAGKNAGKIVAGGLLAYVGALALTAALIAGLAALGVAVWLSALIVGILYAGIGFVILNSGLSGLREVNPAPERTARTLRDDVHWAKEQLR